MIELKNLSKSYGQFKAVDALTLQVASGQVYGFLGPNGAGKTTTIKMMAGLLKADFGEIHLAGHSVFSNAAAAKAITAYVPDRPELFPYLSAMETMRLTARLYSLEASAAFKRAQGLLEIFSLLEWAQEPVSSFSHGMKQKLSIAAALLHKPQVLILDEPMVGLDPKGGRLIKEIMRRLADKGCTIFMSIHTLEIAEKICDRLGILYQGQLLAEGSVTEIKQKAGSGGSEALEDVFLKLTGESNIEKRAEDLKDIL